MILLLDLPGRSIYGVVGAGPAVFYVADAEGGGVPVNTPAYSAALLQELRQVAPPWFAFYPSRMGACGRMVCRRDRHCGSVGNDFIRLMTNYEMFHGHMTGISGTASKT